MSVSRQAGPAARPEPRTAPKRYRVLIVGGPKTTRRRKKLFRCDIARSPRPCYQREESSHSNGRRACDQQRTKSFPADDASYSRHPSSYRWLLSICYRDPICWLGGTTDASLTVASTPVRWDP